ncbi:MAG: MFS transporter [Bifidobacterium sp.]|nr:MFS transporter [Bifidobacterium sp.]
MSEQPQHTSSPSGGTPPAQRKPDQTEPDRTAPQEQPAPRPFPNSDYIRPGIDDRPDWDKALSDEDKAAVQRLAVHQKPRVAPAAATRPEVQAAAMDTSPVGSVDDPLPDPESAFLDLRDPMVDAEGHRPSATDVTRMKVGFALTSFFLSFALAAMNLVLVPRQIDSMDGGMHGSIQFAVLAGVGMVVMVLSTALLQPLSDHTRVRFGRRTPWFVGGAVVAVLFTFALAACSTTVAMTIVWAFMQIGFAAMEFAFFAAIGERVPDKFRDAVAQWRKVAVGAGLLLGVLFGALCMRHSMGGIEICAGLLIAATCCFLFVVPREASSVYLHVKPITTADLTVSLRVPHARSSWVWACLTRLLAGASITVPILFVFFIARYIHGLDDPFSLRDTMVSVVAMAVVAFVCAGVAAVVLRPVYAKWTSDVRWPVVVACVIVIAAGCAPWFMRSFMGLMLYAALCGFSMTMLDDLAQSLAVSVIERSDRRGNYLAVLNTVNTCGKLLGVIAVGITIAASDAILPIIVVSSAFALLTIVTAAFVRQQ